LISELVPEIREKVDLLWNQIQVDTARMTNLLSPPELRPARPTDARFLAEVLEMAGRGHLPRGAWDIVFPEARERRRALEQLAGGGVPSWCHHTLFQVAARGEEACAALVAFEPEELGDVSLGKPMFEVFQRLGWTPERMATVGPLMAPYQRCFPDMPRGSWIIENVGTRQDQRRQGLLNALIERALETGRQRGYARAQISCLIGNLPAQRAYQKAGFSVVEERTDPEFERQLGAPGFSRMTRPL
jgi:translation initiation factor 4G